ncbi:ABC transporter substrate-binding protein [Vreelandella stevensii]|uniref:ABC transporter substrate-binding protein n=1 Tax=Vreelandella stevensii TaxID=502821 RepID=UPI00403AC80D
MLNALLRARSIVTLVLTVFLLFSISATYANDTETPDTRPAPLQLESDLVLPEGLWPSTPPPEVEAAPIGSNEPDTAAPEQASSEDDAPSMALVPPPPLDPPPMKHLSLMLDWYLSPQHAPLIVARERGLFALQGLEVELQTPADPAIAIKLLAAGEVDLALSRQPLLHLNVHDGAPIVRIATLVETPLNAVIVAGTATSPDPLQGLGRVHYGFSTREGRDLLAEPLVPLSLRQIDEFSPAENVHFDAAGALREGRVDAIADGFYLTLPEELASDGIVTHTVRYQALDIPRHDGLILLANNDSVARRAATWSRLVTALEEASNWIVDHPDEAWQLVINTQPVLDNPVNQGAWANIVRRLALSPAALDERRYSAFERYLLASGTIEATLPASRLALNPHTLAEP